ncbi:alpha/beta hydrolase family protein [Nocardioides sp.]|uniref:alpha/beta hydrolase family protein n=1 Tax=Nocardioides sp. TaxID=35761 RepID=UPI0039E56911
MSAFWPFPDNYVWNLSANIALNTGGSLTEVARICERLRATSTRGDDAGTEEFFATWCDQADALVARAEDAAAAGHALTAGELLLRASVYYLTAERMQSRHFPPRAEAYRKGLDAFRSGVRLAERPCESVEVPYGDSAMPAYLVPAVGGGPAPVMVAYNGLDSMKEMIFGSGIAQQLARRGIATLIVDHPGSGEALRLRRLTGRHDSEHWSASVIDHLESRSDVDASRVGVLAWSLGGYYAPRAAAFEKRFKLCVAWGANYNWGELQQRRLAREGDRPVPHYWDHVQWVFGKDSLEEFMAFAPCMSLEGVVEQITVPFLVTHGEQDSQIPLSYAEAQYEHAVSSPDRELRIFTKEEGGSMHCSADDMTVATSFISDWVADRL